jgi:hypothetical protein
MNATSCYLKAFYEVQPRTSNLGLFALAAFTAESVGIARAIAVTAQVDLDGIKLLLLNAFKAVFWKALSGCNQSAF